MNIKNLNYKNIIFFISLCINSFLCSYIHYFGFTTDIIVRNERSVEVEVVNLPKEMSDWEMFTMALMKVESEYDSTAVSNKGAKGYLQITPIYIEEVNRIHGTNYTMKDVTNLELAYEIFDLMQQAHNQNYDKEKAIILHNGKHDWYRNRVMKAYDDIKKYEDVRNRLIGL